MLTGFPPFNGASDEEIINNVKDGMVDWTIPPLKHCSSESIALLKKMLEFHHEKRQNASELLEDDWIKNYAPTAELDKVAAEKVLENLQSFAADQKLISATISYIVNKLVTQEEIKELRLVFLTLDKNNDGKLSYKELISGFTYLYGEASVVSIVDSMFCRLKKDKTKYITYEEFVTSSIDKNNVISDSKLEAAFKLFDRNRDGFIRPSEIKEVLGKNIKREEDYWNNIVREVDEKGSGEISLPQFKQLMSKVLDWGATKKDCVKDILSQQGSFLTTTDFSKFNTCLKKTIDEH